MKKRETKPPAWLRDKVGELLGSHGVSIVTGFLVEPGWNNTNFIWDTPERLMSEKFPEFKGNFSAVREAAKGLYQIIKLPKLDPDTGSPAEPWPEQTVREEIRKALEGQNYDFDPAEIFGDVQNDPKAQARALHILRDYRFLAQAYLHTPGQEPVDILPAFLAVPIYKTSTALNMSPQAGYSDVVTTNATVTINVVDEDRRIEPAPESVSDLDKSKVSALAVPLRVFTVAHAPGQLLFNEAWFYHLHQMIEANAGFSIVGAASLVVLLEERNRILETDIPSFFAEALLTLAETIGQLRYPMGKMRGVEASEEMRGLFPEVEKMGGMQRGFFLDVLRPFLKGTLDRGINYEGTPLTDVREPGGSAAETALFPLWDAILGVKHERPSSRHITEVSRPFHPPLHRKLVDRAASHAKDLRDIVGENTWLREKFDNAVEALFHLRMDHTTLALSYLPQGVPGLGGARDVRQFFSEMLEDTRDAMFDKTRAARLQNPFKSFAKYSVKPGGRPGGS